MNGQYPYRLITHHSGRHFRFRTPAERHLLDSLTRAGKIAQLRLNPSQATIPNPNHNTLLSSPHDLSLVA